MICVKRINLPPTSTWIIFGGIVSVVSRCVSVGNLIARRLSRRRTVILISGLRPAHSSIEETGSEEVDSGSIGFVPLAAPAEHCWDNSVAPDNLPADYSLPPASSDLATGILLPLNRLQPCWMDERCFEPFDSRNNQRAAVTGPSPVPGCGWAS